MDDLKKDPDYKRLRDTISLYRTCESLKKYDSKNNIVKRALNEVTDKFGIEVANFLDEEFKN